MSRDNKERYGIHYDRWVQMRYRCRSKGSKSYEYYGARGIYVCDEWQDFKVFKAWCDKTYIKGRTLDRRDNNGPYSPVNCRWATKSQQQSNCRFDTPRQKAKLKLRVAAAAKYKHKLFGDPHTRKRKHCSRCKTFKALCFFWRRRSETDGRQTICVACTKRLRDSKK